MTKKKLTFCPFVVKNSGYGLLSDNIYKTLLKYDYDINYVSQYSKNANDIQSDINLIISIPPSYLKTKSKLNVGYTMFEATRIPNSWVSYCNIMDRLFVPIKNNIETFKKCGVNIPIDLIPIGIDAEIYDDLDDDLDDDFDDSDLYNSKDFQFHHFNFGSNLNSELNKTGTYKFLMINDGQTRKNNEFVIRAFNIEFKKEIKENKVFLIIRSYRELKGQNIIYIRRFLDDKELPNLIRSCDCMISASSGEGGDIPILEGMAMKKPVIVSKGFAHDDYIIPNGRDQNGFFIETDHWEDAYKNIEYKPDPFFNELEGARWIYPDFQSLRDKMRLVYENRELAERVGQNARKYILENRTLDIMIRKMIDVFEKEEDQLLYR